MFIGIAGEDLEPGDLVTLDNKGIIMKARAPEKKTNKLSERIKGILRKITKICTKTAKN